MGFSACRAVSNQHTMAVAAKTPSAGFAVRAVLVNSRAPPAQASLLTAARATIRNAREMCSNAAPETKKGLVYLISAWPITTAVVTTLVRTAPCDLLAQLYFEKKTEIDWRRFWGFMIFGGLYVGIFQYYFYTYLLNAANLALLTGITSKAPSAVGIALVDQFAHSPFLYFPAFVLTLKIVDGCPLDQLAGECFAKWQREVVGVITAACTLWLPAQIINFYFLPPYLTVPYINAVGAIWVVWLSLNEGKSKDKAKATIE